MSKSVAMVKINKLYDATEDASVVAHPNIVIEPTRMNNLKAIFFQPVAGAGNDVLQKARAGV